ncbi:MAG: membrane protein insertion efficiency factor YidD [Bacteroidales bacterium]|nr:membrane protein insertion efficiency factor YidD [Bacteroidales bacterium]
MKLPLYYYITVICLLFSLNGYSQQPKEVFSSSDLQLLSAHTYADSSFNDRKVKYGFGKSNKTINPVYHLLSSSMFIYQQYVSSVLSRQCAFNPSCSRYSKDLISRYGLLKGTFCTADRLMRCNRISLADKHSVYLLSEGGGHINETPLRYKF